MRPTPTHAPSVSSPLHPTAPALRLSLGRAILSAVMLLSPAWAARAQTPGRAQTNPLPGNDSQEFNIGGDEIHAYDVALSPGEFFQARVTQLGTDVLLRLLGAGGREVARMSSPHELESVETLTFVASAPAAYTLEVTASDPKAAAGKYRIMREPSRAASAQDRRRVEVERTFVEARAARASEGQAEVAQQKFTEALAGWQELADEPMAAMTKHLLINTKGFIAFRKGKSLVFAGDDAKVREAFRSFGEAREFYHQIGETESEAAALLGMSQAKLNLKDEAGQIEILKEIYPLYSKPEEKDLRADILIAIAQYYLRVQDDSSALEYLRLVYPLYEEMGRNRETAIVANSIGALYYKAGDNENAYQYMHKALPLKQYLGSKCDELELLTNLGIIALEFGRTGEAINYLRDETPALYEGPGGCSASKAEALNDLGKAYFDLGEYLEAGKQYQAAFNVSADNAMKAVTSNNLGTVSYALGEYRRSPEYAPRGRGEYDDPAVYYNRALKQYEQALIYYKGDVKNQATTLTNVGVVQAALGDYQLALTTLNGALKMRQDIGDKDGEAITLTHLSEIYLNVGDKLAAQDRSNRALALFASIDDPAGEATALANAMNVARVLGSKRLAVFYGKLSVNKLQELRGATREADGEIQMNFLRTVKGPYQHLAELLVSEGMLEQAVQVLNLYQDQQFFDFDFDRKAEVQHACLSTREEALANRYEAEGRKLKRLEQEIAELERQSRDRQPQAAGDGNLSRLKAEATAARAAFAAVLGDAASEFGAAQEEKAEIDEVKQLRAAVRDLGAEPGQKAVMLYPLVGDENFYVLLLTPSGVKAFSQPVGAAEVNHKVREMLAVLSCPDFDPYRESAALYKLIFGATSTQDKRTTLEAEVEKENPSLLLWSPGATMGSIPTAALYDDARKQFLVERYQQAVFTRARADRISGAPKRWDTGIGLGVSKSLDGYPAMPTVSTSLPLIFGDESANREGILRGRVLLNDRFDKGALLNLDGKWPLVHIASHFFYFPGNSQDSRLLLGNGDYFTLSEMQKDKQLFSGVEMLMLAACQTAVSRPNDIGRAVDGFAELSQRLGARSVIATLWNISISETPRMEIGFYSLYRDHHDWPKSEILRRTQLDFLSGKVRPIPTPAAAPAGDGKEIQDGCDAGAGRRRFTPDPKAPLAHPYYWAPFVLYGSSR